MKDKHNQVDYGVTDGGAVIIALPKYKLGDVVWCDRRVCFIKEIELIVGLDEKIYSYYRISKCGVVNSSELVDEHAIELVSEESLTDEVVKAEYEFAKATYNYLKAKRTKK